MSKEYHGPSATARLTVGQLSVRLSAADGSARHSWAPVAPPIQNSTTVLATMLHLTAIEASQQRIWTGSIGT